MNSPHNPTGKVFSVEDLSFIADLCQKWNVYAILDEVSRLCIGSCRELVAAQLAYLLLTSSRVVQDNSLLATPHLTSILCRCTSTWCSRGAGTSPCGACPACASAASASAPPAKPSPSLPGRCAALVDTSLYKWAAQRSPAWSRVYTCLSPDDSSVKGQRVCLSAQQCSG